MILCHSLAMLIPMASAQEQVRLEVRRAGGAVELHWPASLIQKDRTIGFPFFELQQSADLQSWQPIGERMRGQAGASDGVLTMRVPGVEGPGFFRLQTTWPKSVTTLAINGAQVFGYAEAFATHLERIGQISPQQFAALYPSGADYLPRLSWDPTTAKFWDSFNVDPDVVNKGKNSDDPDYRTFDFRLDERELAGLKQNGFVVSERLGSGSFGDVFYNIWHNDLPVFVSTDAILQAWHRTYDAMLEEIEETYLFNSAQQILDAMAARLPEAWAEAGNGVLKESLRDADYFLTVARSLLVGGDRPLPSMLGQDARVAETLH